eukprot:s1716_g9.t1
MFVQQVARIVAISPSGFIPRVPRLYHVLRARCPAQKLGKCFFCTRCTVVAQACWCCLIPLAPHCLCTCWYQKERFARSVRSENQGMADASVHNLWSRFVWQLFVKRGVASATLATCQRVNWFDLSALFRDVGRHSRPVLLVWGERDTLNPPSTIGKKVAAFFANAKLLVIPRAGHIAICDKPAEVVPTILGFLQLPEDMRSALSQLMLRALWVNVCVYFLQALFCQCLHVAFPRRFCLFYKLVQRQFAVPLGFLLAVCSFRHQVNEQLQRAPVGSPFSFALCHMMIDILEHRFYGT